MAIAAPLEALPNELLDSILNYFTNDDLLCADAKSCITSLSLLSQCSRYLNQRLEFMLYTTRDARNTALIHGCRTGNLWDIRKTISCGAVPGVVHIYDRNNDSTAHLNHDRRYQVVSSLQVALKSQQLDAFNFLLDLGSDVTLLGHSNPEIARSQLTRFARRLEKPSNGAFLEAFLKARAKTPDWTEDDTRADTYSQAQAVVRRLRFPDVVLWAPLALLQTLIDNGAHLDKTTMSTHTSCEHYQPLPSRPLSPLSAACLRGDKEIFDLLVACGASVNSKSNINHDHHTHIPVFIAVHHMFDTGNTKMLDACIASGAGINRPCHFRQKERGSTPSPTHICSTPLLTYLGLIDSWDSTSSSTDKEALTPIDAIRYFIHALAGDLASPVMPLVGNGKYLSDAELHQRSVQGLPSPVELLLKKWGIKSLAIPEFFSVIQLLTEHGGTGSDLARLLVNCDDTNDPSGTDQHGLDVDVLWQQFLRLLDPHMGSLDQLSKNSLLRRVIMGKANIRHGINPRPYSWKKIPTTGLASISAVIRAGADINNTEDVIDTREFVNKVTPMHQILNSFIHTDCLTDIYFHDHPEAYDCHHTRLVTKNLGEFLSFLIEQGANPLIEDSREHLTAIDTLVSPMKEGRIENVRGTAEQALMKLVAKLERAVQVREYSGDREPYEGSIWSLFSNMRHYHHSCTQEGWTDAA